MSSILSDNLPTPGFFTTAIQADENINPFEDSFKHGNSAIERTRVEFNGGTESNAWSRPLCHDNTLSTSVGDGDYDDLFGFSPRRQLSTPPRRRPGQGARPECRIDSTNDMNVTSPVMWETGKANERFGFGQQPMIKTQELSPPNSIDNSPVDWTYDTFQPLLSPLHSMLTDTQTTDTRSRYGQVTPPMDEAPGSMMVDGAFGYGQSLAPKSNFQRRPTGPSTDEGEVNSKRKRVEESPEHTNGAASKASSTKRQRKSSTRSKPEPTSPKGSMNPQDDVKRSKFLERNRVAASKCRQKKKEWTSNLEAKARDLQNSKTQLAIMVSSLKEEMLFLKGELLKHSNCNCTRIRDYLDHEVTNLAHASTQHPQLNSPTSSRCSGQDSEILRTSDDLEHTSLESPASESSTRHGSGDESRTDDELHALLSAQLERSTDAETEAQNTTLVDM
ncbi:MAG: hypothetical protein M1835_007721 [Candelina submexicana]|nr:MAG: hypothetical protein M1835_007721 [Candelina submexicana]